MLNALEKEVVIKFCEYENIQINDLGKQLDTLKVKSRKLSGVGFITAIEVPNALVVMSGTESFTGGRVGMYLNDERINTGYLIYIKEGCLEGIEGYTYDDPWPASVSTFDSFKLD